MIKVFALLLFTVLPQSLVARDSVALIETNHFYDEFGRLDFDQIIFWDWEENAVLTKQFTSPFCYQPILQNDKGEAVPIEPTGNGVVRGPRFQVVAWRHVKHPDQLPRQDYVNGGYVAQWLDGEQLRQVRSVSFRETWEQFDPELVEREYLPKEKRRELRTLKGAK